jgi:hypothetical protein
MTHLVMGEGRRTLKVLLAVANGAHILAPTWLTASLEAVRGLRRGCLHVRPVTEAERPRLRVCTR